MQHLKFTGMYNAFKLNVESGTTEKFTADEIGAQLFQSEWDERQNRSITKKIHDARFRYRASVEDIYYLADRNLDNNHIHRLAQY